MSGANFDDLIAEVWSIYFYKSIYYSSSVKTSLLSVCLKTLTNDTVILGSMLLNVLGSILGSMFLVSILKSY